MQVRILVPETQRKKRNYLFETTQVLGVPVRWVCPRQSRTFSESDRSSMPREVRDQLNILMLQCPRGPTARRFYSTTVAGLRTLLRPRPGRRDENWNSVEHFVNQLAVALAFNRVQDCEMERLNL
jgi:hypothetical protein